MATAVALSGGSTLHGVTDNQKRWLVFGIALSKVLVTQIRPFVEQEVQSEYGNLQTSHSIHTQSTSGRLKKWPTYLKYENINGNDALPRLPGGRFNYSLFDCRVTSHVDFARLYVENHMAKFNAFDEHCDASAVLTLLGKVPVFSPAVQSASNDVRQARNAWAHCVFSDWDPVSYQQSLNKIKTLVKALGLPPADERNLLVELKDWESKGTILCMNATVDPDLLKLVQQHVNALKTDVDQLTLELKEDKERISQALKDISTSLEELEARVASVQHEQEVMKQVQDSLSDKMDSLETNMDSTQVELKNLKSQQEDVHQRVAYVEEKVNSANENQEASRGQRSLDGSYLKSEVREEPVNIHGHVMEVNDIVQALSDNSSKAAAAVFVSGISGIGKTTVAIQASNQLTSKHGSIVKFCSLRCVQSGEESKGERELREILNVCAPEHQQTNENPRHVLLNWCRRLEREMILVLDNAEDVMEEDVKDFFTELLKDMRKCSQSKLKFLITSRRSRIDTGLNVKAIKLGPLDLEESIEVLKCNAKFESKSEELRDNLQQIAELCEHIPLALELAGHLLSSESEYTVEELIQELQNNATKTLGCERMMEIAFEKLDESLQKALVSLSVFVRFFDRDAAKALLHVDIHYARCLTKLRERCLIQKRGDRYLIHLLIRSYARQIGRKKFPQTLERGQQAFFEHFLSLILRNAKTYWGKDTCKNSFDLFNAERLNYESTLRDFSNWKIRNCRQLEDVLNDCRLVAPYIGACVPINLYENVLTDLLQFAEDQEKVIHRVEILCLRYNEGRKRGGARKELQDEAIKLHDENSHLFEQNGLSEVFYASYFARYLLQDCNRGEQAQPVLEKALAVYENKLKPESFEKENPESTYDVARILGQMGHYAKKQGRTEEACENYLEALRLLKNGYGNHILTAFAYKDVADSYLFVHQYSEAEENYEKAMAILEDMQKANHREAIPVFKNWGICFEKSCKYVESREKYEKGSGIAENTIEGNHKWKVEINTYLALLLYTRCPEDASTASRIASEVLQMGKELKLNGWPRKKELEEMDKTHETI